MTFDEIIPYVILVVSVVALAIIGPYFQIAATYNWWPFEKKKPPLDK